jgi:hypothetical protein
MAAIWPTKTTDGNQIHFAQRAAMRTFSTGNSVDKGMSSRGKERVEERGEGRERR